MTRPVLIVRPEPGNANTAARARAVGLDVRAVPLFAIRPLAWEAPDAAPYVGVLLTSASALRLAGPDLAGFTHLPAFAVGGATAQLAREAGFVSVVEGDSDVSRLVGKIATLGLHRLLHFCGAEVRPFDPFGIEIDRLIVYSADLVDTAAELAAAIAEAPVVLIHSPRAGARLAGLVEPAARARVALVAISANAAEAAGAGWEEVAIVAEPRDEALLQEAVRMCRQT
jgi:uroporphyrinogen-III synthase